FVDVVESAIRFAAETGPEISYQDLCAFVESKGFLFESDNVVERGNMSYQKVDKTHGRVIRLIQHTEECLVEFLTVNHQDSRKRRRVRRREPFRLAEDTQFAHH